MKKTSLLFSIFICCLSFLGYSQKTYKLPVGQKILKDYNNKEIQFNADFDNDGTNDVVLVCVDKNDDRNIFVYLSSRYFTKGIYSWFNWAHTSYDFEFDNKILTLIGTSGNQIVEKLKFKYYSESDNLRLIQFDAHLFEKHTVIDFLSNQYAKDIIQKKTSFNVVTLSNIEKFLEYFGSNGW
jgi:hypothetical protein